MVIKILSTFYGSEDLPIFGHVTPMAPCRYPHISLHEEEEEEDFA